ncbi:DUF4188 domain-containing protein [Oceanobacillus saliphilus]|uniref:DUF4188 domain-containing protein n=1 Tax=Oceanobacillus saliphilus TaxID=2925834 RepID=UPI00201D81C5|nr:DUF4188 domain-containing protein [Oceanobacillus saliphilus]
MGKFVFQGRHTTDNDKDMVVFLIGMRINKRRAISKWLPVIMAMPPMIRELYENKEDLGFLSTETYFGLRTTVMIQYWRSVDDVLSYAKSEKHLQAWKNFNKQVRGNDAVGVYHETYQVEKGNYEAIYVNMPLYGLGKAAIHQPVTPETNSAKKRISSEKNLSKS